MPSDASEVGVLEGLCILCPEHASHGRAEFGRPADGPCLLCGKNVETNVVFSMISLSELPPEQVLSLTENYLKAPPIAKDEWLCNVPFEFLGVIEDLTKKQRTALKGLLEGKTIHEVMQRAFYKRGILRTKFMYSPESEREYATYIIAEGVREAWAMLEEKWRKK